MNIRKATAVIALLLINQLAIADASYQSTTQITGGSLVDTIKQVSFLSKSIKESLAPITTLTMVHGNQKAVVGKDTTEITDLDKEYLIHIDNVRKTYTITTFAQMRQAFANMPKQMDKMKQAQANQPNPQQPSDIKTTFDVKVNNTGVSKVVNGFNAQEQIITLTMKATPTNPPPPAASQPLNPNTPTSVDYTVTTDAWITPDPPQIKEIADFDVRMGKKLMEGVDMSAFAEQMKQMQGAGNASMAQLMGGKPGASDAMAQMAKEVAKLKGTRVLETTSMGGLVPAGTVVAGSPATPPPTGQSIAAQVATDTATQTAAEEASKESGKLGIFGAALNNSAFSAFHRKKSTPPPPPAAAPTTPTTSGATGAAAAPAMQNVVLMSTTSQKSNFSDAPVSPSNFQIPVGYKQLESMPAPTAQ